MKKSVLFVVLFVFAFLIVFSAFFWFNKSKDKNGSFDNAVSYDVLTFALADYQQEMETFSYNKTVNQLDTAERAVSTAKELWLDKYGVVNGKPYNPINGEPIIVAYDEINECWLIHGTLPSNMLGAVPYALIKSDGTVLAIWMG